MALTSREPCAVVFPPCLVVVPSRPPANDNGREWRCRDCDALLGIAQHGALHTKYKEALWRIVGTCECLCRRCGARNVVTVGLGWALPTDENESQGASLPQRGEIALRLSKMIEKTECTVRKHDAEYQRAREDEPALAQHPSANALLAVVSGKNPRCFRESQPIVLALVRQHQRTKHPLWQALLLRVFYPMLRRLRTRLRGVAARDADAELLVAFLEALSWVRPDPERAFLSVRCATARELFQAARAQDAEVETVPLDEDTSYGDVPAHAEPSPFVQCLAHELVDRMAREPGGEDVAWLLAGAETMREQFERLGGDEKVTYACLEMRRRRTLIELRREVSLEREAA